MAKSSLDKMKERLKKSSPKISGRMNLENMNQIRNFVFGKKKAMGVDDDVLGIATQKAKKKIADNKKKTKKPLGKSPGALGGKIKSAPKVDKNKIAKDSDSKARISLRARKEKFDIDQAYKRNEAANKNKKVKSKVKATAANTKDFAKTMAMQKKLIAKGAKIKADGLMGPKTRAAMKKFMSSPKTMVDSFKKSNVSANKNNKAGIDAAKGDNKKAKTFKSSNPKLDSKGNYKGTNIKPTKLQLERMKKRRARASST